MSWYINHYGKYDKYCYHIVPIILDLHGKGVGLWDGRGCAKRKLCSEKLGVATLQCPSPPVYATDHAYVP